MKKFLDYEGLKKVFNLIKANFVGKEAGKGLSSNDFTDSEKEKLDNLIPVEVFQGATDATDGTSGMVPAPIKGEQNDFLRGDGTWAPQVQAEEVEWNNDVGGTVTYTDGSTLTIPSIPAASQTNSGVVTTGAQTFAGTKTFENIISGISTSNRMTISGAKTTEEWRIQSIEQSFVPAKGEILIFTDRQMFIDGEIKVVYGVKVGDGSTIAIDLPYLDDNTYNALVEHMQNAHIHTTEEQQEFWNNKVTAFVVDNNNLTLSKD